MRLLMRLFKHFVMRISIIQEKRAELYENSLYNSIKIHLIWHGTKKPRGIIN
jgi:hypothetical protein